MLLEAGRIGHGVVYLCSSASLYLYQLCKMILLLKQKQQLQCRVHVKKIF